MAKNLYGQTTGFDLVEGPELQRLILALLADHAGGLTAPQLAVELAHLQMSTRQGVLKRTLASMAESGVVRREPGRQKNGPTQLDRWHHVPGRDAGDTQGDWGEV